MVHPDMVPFPEWLAAPAASGVQLPSARLEVISLWAWTAGGRFTAFCALAGGAVGTMPTMGARMR